MRCRCIVLLLSLLLVIASLPISSTVDFVPKEVKLYLADDEEVEQVFRVTQKQANKIDIDFVFYRVKKGGKLTDEYIIWDNVVQAVVGGYKWPSNYGLHSYKSIVSYIEKERVAEFIDKVSNLTEIRDEIEKLRDNSIQLNNELGRSGRKWGIIVGTIVGIVVGVAITIVTGGAASLIFSIAANTVIALWRIQNLQNFVAEWKIDPLKYPVYYLTLVMIGQFSDDNSIDSSAQELKNALENIQTSKNKLNTKLVDGITKLHNSSFILRALDIKSYAESFGKDLAVDYLARLLGTLIPVSLHFSRGVLGNKKFYDLFGQKFIDKIETSSFRLLGGEKELGLKLDEFKQIVWNVGKQLASHFRAKAVSGIPKEEILKSLRNYEEMLSKAFAKEKLLRNLKVSFITVISEIAAEHATKGILNYLNKDAKEVATNGFIHADISLLLIDTIQSLKDLSRDNDAFKSYANALQSLYYAVSVLDNYVEFWNTTILMYQSNPKLLNDGNINKWLGGWFSARCSFNNLDEFLRCGEQKIEYSYKIIYRSIVEDFIELDERVSYLADSYIANISKRLGNAIPKTVRESDVVLVLDTSGSMNNPFLKASKIDTLKVASKHLVKLFQAMGGKIRVGIVSFSSDARLLSNLTTDYNYTNKIIDGLFAEGSTAMGDGLHLALQTLSKGSDERFFKAIILLTDGRSNTGRDPKDVLYKELSPSGIPVFTIGIGKGVQEYDPIILSEIASKTGGTFYEVDPTKGIDETELTKIFLRIGLGVAIGGQSIGEDVIMLSQGEKAEFKIDATDGKSFAVMAMYSGSRVELNLYTPTGERLLSSQSSIYVSKGGFEAWIVKDPEPGIYTAELIGKNVTKETPMSVFTSINKPAIEIEPRHLEINLTSSNTHEITFKVKSISEQQVRNLVITLKGGIAQIATVEPKLIPSLPPNGEYVVSLKITAPKVEGLYDGFIEVSDGWFTESIPVLLTYRQLVLSVYTDKNTYLIDEDIRIYATLADNENKRVTGANVSLIVGSKTSKNLLDNGIYPDEKPNDGVYSAVINNITPSTGNVIISVTAHKSGYPTVDATVIVNIIGKSNTSTQTTIITTQPPETEVILGGQPSFNLIVTLVPIVLITSLMLLIVYAARISHTCKYCGLKNRRNARTCRGCGKRLR